MIGRKAKNWKYGEMVWLGDLAAVVLEVMISAVMIFPTTILAVATPYPFHGGPNSLCDDVGGVVSFRGGIEEAVIGRLEFGGDGARLVKNRRLAPSRSHAEGDGECVMGRWQG